MPDEYYGPPLTENPPQGKVEENGEMTDLKANKTTSNVGSLVFYNTVSCPCSSYAIDLGNGNIGCERDSFGTLKSVKSVLVKKHLIENKRPKIGDKWLCNSFKCEQDDFKWDTFYIVKVEKDLTESSSSIFNAKTSTLNCYISKVLPTTGSLAEIRSVSNPISYINNNPLYKTKLEAQDKNEEMGYPTDFLEYNKDGLSGYLSGGVIGDEKLITSVTISGKSIAKWPRSPFIGLSNMKDDDTSGNKVVFHKNGDTFRIKITGVNNPMFTFSLKDSSGCDVLREKYKNVICKGTFDLSHAIPALPSGVAKETYDFTMLPAADTKYQFSAGTKPTSETVNIKIYQYKDAVFTFSVISSTLASASTARSAGGSALESSAFSGSVSSKTHTTTITHANRNLYVKNPIPAFNEVVVKSNVIKRFIIKDDNLDTSETNNIKVIARPEHNASDVAIYQGDLQENMLFNASITKTKTIRKSIDLDIHKEPCDDCPETDIFTNKFEIDNTNDIFEGMRVTGKNSIGAKFYTRLQSVDCGKSITLANSQIILKNTDLTFDYVVNGNILTIEDCSEGELLYVTPAVQLPHGSEIKFENGNFSNINGSIKSDKNGAKSVVITTTIDEIVYGQEDVTFTLDINDLVTFKPNIRDQYLTFGKNSTANSVDFTRDSIDLTQDNQTVTINKQPSNGTLSLTGKVYTYAPNHNFTGKDRLDFILVDPNGDDAQSSDQKSIFITVK